MILPRILRPLAPVAEGQLLVLPWKARRASQAKQAASLAIGGMPCLAEVATDVRPASSRRLPSSTGLKAPPPLTTISERSLGPCVSANLIEAAVNRLSVASTPGSVLSV